MWQAFLCFCLFSFAQAKPSVDTLSLEEKIGQILMVHLNEDKASSEAKYLIQDLKIGGIIYYNWSSGLYSFSQVKTLSEELQPLSPSIPLFIAIDQEGGIVTRLKQGFTLFPGNAALLHAGSYELTYQCALAMGKEMRKAGINFNLAPVVDIGSNPRNAIGIRSFGNNPQVVTLYAQELLKGYKEAGVLSCLKHYPGHGDVEVDSHQGLPHLNKNLEVLKKVDLYPFQELASTCDSIMTAHLLAPALDEKYPVTLSYKALNYLRKEIGFQGLILSDSLLMKGIISSKQDVAQAAILAFNAGCDILLIGGQFLNAENEHGAFSAKEVGQVYKSLVEAVKQGIISEERLNASVQRILEAKEKLTSPTYSYDPKEHQSLAKKIASLALETNLTKTPLLKNKKLLLLMPAHLKDNAKELTFLPECQIVFYEDKIDNLPTEPAEVFLVITYNAWKSPDLIHSINTLLQETPTSIILAVGNPLDIDLLPHATGYIKTFSPIPISLEAAWEELEKKIK